MEPTSGSTPFQPPGLPPSRPSQAPPPKRVATPPPRPTQANPIAEWEHTTSSPEKEEFTSEQTDLNTAFSKLYQQEPLQTNSKIHSLVFNNLDLLGKLTNNYAGCKLSFNQDGRIDFDQSPTAVRAVSGTVKELTQSDNPYDIRHLAIYMVFLEKYMDEYRKPSSEMHQVVGKLNTAIAGLKELSKLYVDQDKDDNLDILTKSIFYMKASIDKINEKIAENNSLTLPQLTNEFDEIMVNLKLTAPGQQILWIAGLAQSIHSYDGLNVIARSDKATLDSNNFGQFAKHIEKLSIGSKPDEYLLKELILAEFFIMHEEVIQPAYQQLKIPNLKNAVADSLKKLEAAKIQLQTIQEELSKTTDESQQTSLIIAEIAAEDDIKQLDNTLKAAKNSLQEAEDKLPASVKNFISQKDKLFAEFDKQIKPHYGDDTKNKLAMKILRENGLFAESLKLASTRGDEKSSTVDVDGPTTMLWRTAAKLAGGVALTALSVANPAMAPFTFKLGVDMVVGSLAGIDNVHVKEAAEFLAKIDDPEKARKKIEEIVKQTHTSSEQSAKLSEELWKAWQAAHGFFV